MTYIVIDPVALDLGILKIHWYGLMYLLAFLVAFLLARYRGRADIWDKKKIENLIFYSALGAIIGGRVGYIIFYQFNYFLYEPLLLFKIWQGGMSFHGGLIGVLSALFLLSRRTQMPFFALCDFVAPLVPLGLGFGRLANYVNGELWGKQTLSSWGVYGPNADGIWANRFPSQLYEAFFEGLLLFIIVWLYSKKSRPMMHVSALFLFCYGIFRFSLEFIRAPDAHIGYLAFGWLTMGQVLTVPMIIIGVLLFIFADKKHAVIPRFTKTH